MHRTLASLFDEARLLLSPPHTDNVLASPPKDPLVYYHLYPIIWAFAIVIGLLTWFGRCVLAGRIMLLQDLAKIYPEDRNEFIRKRCRIYNVQLKFVEDLEDKYEYEYGYQDEKEVLIEVV